jgi:acyl carrier protein
VPRRERIAISMIASRVIELIEESTQSVPGTLHEETELACTGVWDSMSMVMFIGLVQEETGVELKAEDMQSCATPAQLTNAIARRARR